MDRRNAKPDIVDMINCRNPKGYRLLCDNYSAILYGLIIRIVRDTEAAEDLLEETFKKICKNIGQYSNSQLSFLSWMLQLARSVCIDYLCITQQQSEADNYTASDNTGTRGRGNSEMVMMPVADVASDEVKIFNMILLGYKVNEVAEKLNMPVATVKINIRKGMKIKANRI